MAVCRFSKAIHDFRRYGFSKGFWSLCVFTELTDRSSHVLHIITNKPQTLRICPQDWSVITIMASSVVTRYLRAKLDEFPYKHRSSAEVVVKQAEEAIKAKLILNIGDEERLEIAHPARDLSGLILSYAYKQNMIEESIRQQRLKETTQRKRELQEKLGYLENQIEILEESSPNKQSKGEETQGMTDEERLNFIKKMEKHRRRRDRVRQEQITKMQNEIAKMEEDERKQTEALQAEHHRTMMKQLKETEKELKRREAERLLFKSQSDQAFQAVVRSKPRYVQIEQRYEESIALPNLEEKKHRLAELRKYFAPIKHEELQEHAKHYDEMKRTQIEATQHKYKQPKHTDPDPSKLYYKGRYGEIVDQEDREFKEALVKQDVERRRLIEKRKQYGVLVTDIYKPETNFRLTADVKQREATIKNTRTSLLSPPKSGSITTRKSYNVKDIDFRKSIETKAFKPNPMVPKPKEKKSPKQLDFLAEQRKRRDRIFLEMEPRNIDKMSWDETNMPETTRERGELILKADKQIERAKRQDLVLSSVNPASLKNLQAREEVDDAIVDSLKAKLAVLNSIGL